MKIFETGIYPFLEDDKTVFSHGLVLRPRSKTEVYENDEITASGKNPKVVFSIVFDPLHPRYKNAYSPYCISYRASKENLLKYQDIFSLAITSFIFITCMFEQVLIMQREISFSLLLGFIGLIRHLYSEIEWNRIQSSSFSDNSDWRRIRMDGA